MPESEGIGGMSKKGQPKYNIGDSVFIIKEGMASKIRKILQFNGEWYYLLDNQRNLFAEENLHHELDLKHKQKHENIHIEYKFHFGDIVRVKGYGQELFVIIGFRAEIWRYKESSWEDIIYELSRLTDGGWLEATEEELTYITNEENARRFYDTKTKANTKNQLYISPPKTNNRQKEMVDIDELLDMYNDYQYLYQNFGENGYKKKMKEILKKLEAISRNPFKKQS